MKNLIIITCFVGLLMFSCKKNEVSDIHVVKLAETTKSWNGDTLPKYPNGQPKVTVLRITIPPKKKLEIHKHPEINAGVLLKGALTVISEKNDTLYLKEGDPIVELVNTWHYGENDGDIPAEIIVFYAVIEGTPITVVKHE